MVDQRAARLRLEYVGRQKITRPADWLMREADAAMGVGQYWLTDPIVEQGSMNGRFASVLDRKRLGRSRAWTWLRFRWDRWRRRTLTRDRGDEFVAMGSLTTAERARDDGQSRSRARRRAGCDWCFYGCCSLQHRCGRDAAGVFAAPSSLSRAYARLAPAAGPRRHRVLNRPAAGCHVERSASPAGAESVDRVAPLLVVIHCACDFRHSLFEARYSLRSSSSLQALRRSLRFFSLISALRKRHPTSRGESFSVIT